MKITPLFIKDALLILVMALLAGCGLVYEYLLSHYAGRVLGAVESAIYTMIGIMIVSMGLGAFAARKIKDAFNGFVILEVVIAILGASSILFIALVISLTYDLPQILADTYNIPFDALPEGGWLKTFHQFSLNLPYIVGIFLGLFIGMEIPLIARVREHLYGQHLQHNAGTIYGADYIGAGAGAAIWVAILMRTELSSAAAWTASVNVIAGTIFLFLFWRHIKFKTLIIASHLLVVGLIIAIGYKGEHWMQKLTDVLYQDKVVYQQQTQYQQLIFTERSLGPEQAPIHQFFLNGRLQFSSQDEFIYHEMLVHPAMAAAARQHKVLIIGGGDGLGLREVLKWQPEKVTLVDLDQSLIELFQHPETYLPGALAEQMQALGQNALNHENVDLRYADAFNEVDNLLRQGEYFDVIIVDLPDPNHPDLNKLYTRHFYLRLNQLLSADGVMAVQSTSPYHAKNAFVAIGKTVNASGFTRVEQYQQNVPSFGQWGWTLASKSPVSLAERLAGLNLPFETRWLDDATLQAAFVFPKHYYRNLADIKINDLGSHVIYQYHHQAWREQKGTVFD
ncbi:polyamine aminopropyltransferase [Catenovulum sp. SM1970]|uniref:polyamine aminopropyltransferase n=1 Tax=Marinifaba aquimaris TaxID=2741323 RepID=UPI0015729D23|nr:polyamine aminopropyltransferase [Marinifaba aquimaris]NTS75923.1 polyamine aminopropyltransferase [Marinifaba aquimaris]